MKSWTLIPFYLWKNTFRRWLEYPVSPFSKILIPTLLGLLAVIVLALFSEVERELREQLSKSSVHTVYVSEFVSKENAATVLGRTYEEEVMWSSRYGMKEIKQVRQLLTSATWGMTQTAPVLAFTSSLAEFEEDETGQAPPKVWLLSGDRSRHGLIEEIAIAGKKTVAETRAIPDWMERGLSMENVVAVPISMIEPYLFNGFLNHTVADLDSIQSVGNYVRDVSAFYRAEGRSVKVVSALEILRNLERIEAIQKIIRTLIVLGCGIILALTLGSVAWLEYRQEAYLLALLRSFGTPSIVLLFHMFMENLILVLGGILIVWVAWVPLYEIAGPHLQSIGLQSGGVPPIAVADMGIIVLAGGVGVVFAMIPVAFGLRKPAGLILQ